MRALDLYFCPVFSFFFCFFSSPNLSGLRLDVYHTSTHGVALVRIFVSDIAIFVLKRDVKLQLTSANLGCTSEIYYTRLAENTGRKNRQKNRHLGTIALAQLCRAVSSQLRHVSTIGKKM